MARRKRKDSPEAKDAGEAAVGDDVVQPELSEEDTAERAALQMPVPDATEVYFSREEPAAVEPEPAGVEPESAVVEPEPAVVEPEPAVVEPEPAAVEAVAVEPEPVAVEPEPAVEEPAPPEPEPVAEPAAAQPDAEPQPAAAPPTYGTGGTSPAAADRRAAEEADPFSQRPELFVAAAFVGALVFAKLLKRLTRGSGD